MSLRSLLTSYLSKLVLCADENVQFDPASNQHYYSTSTWASFYSEKYLPLARQCLTKPVCKNMFFELRKYHRRQYQKSKRIKQKGYLHLSCSVCDYLLAAMRKETDERQKSFIRADLIRHKDHYVRGALCVSSKMTARQTIDRNIYVSAGRPYQGVRAPLL